MHHKQETVPDNTAVRVALWRALHVEVDSPPHVLEDEVGLKLAAPDDGWRSRPDMSPFTRPFRASIVARARFIEDLVAEQAAHGVGQYVILGAGLDTFAYRQPQYAGALHIYEVDHPATQAWKCECLAKADIPLPSNLSWVPVDFECQTLPEQLAAAGFDGSRPAVFSWLGVMQYLTLTAVDETLGFVAGLPSSTKIVLSFLLSDDALADDERERKRQIGQAVAGLGEPWLTFFHPDELCTRLHDLGFAQTFHLTPEKANARYLAGRTDGLQLRPLEQFISATV
jgi:methyltransferase (TIGR00027 family)